MVRVECAALERRVQRLERRVAELALAPAVEAVERREQREPEEVGERRERAALRPVGAAVQRLERSSAVGAWVGVVFVSAYWLG